MTTNKYKVTQLYSTVKDVHLNKKLETPRNMGTFLGVSALQALRIASQYTNIAEICLHANRVKEVITVDDIEENGEDRDENILSKLETRWIKES